MKRGSLPSDIPVTLFKVRISLPPPHTHTHYGLSENAVVTPYTERSGRNPPIFMVIIILCDIILLSTFRERFLLFFVLFWYILTKEGVRDWCKTKVKHIHTNTMFCYVDFHATLFIFIVYGSSCDHHDYTCSLHLTKCSVNTNMLTTVF